MRILLFTTLLLMGSLLPAGTETSVTPIFKNIEGQPFHYQSAARKKEQKKILRKLRDLSKVIMKHGERYTNLLQNHRETKTNLSEAQADCILERLLKMQAFLPIAIEQAVSRILKDLKEGGYISIEKKRITIHHKLPSQQDPYDPSLVL